MKIERVGLVLSMATMFFTGLSSRAELETWTLKDGTSVEAEFMTTMSDYALLKDENGSSLKIMMDQFSPESKIRIGLAKPPKLKIDLIKDQNTKVFSAGINEDTQRPPERRTRYGVRLKQTSTNSYDSKLNTAIYVIGQQRLGDDKFILLDLFRASFKLTNENKRTFECMSTREVVLRKYEVESQIRGEDYYGYIAVVKDVRDEVIATVASHNWMTENVENLGRRSIGNYMDKSFERVFPARPASIYH